MNSCAQRQRWMPRIRFSCWKRLRLQLFVHCVRVQVMDWVCMLLDAHFTVLVMTPEVKGLLLKLHNFVSSQVTNGFPLLPLCNCLCWHHADFLTVFWNSFFVLRWSCFQSLERSKEASKSSTRWRWRRPLDNTPLKSLSCFRKCTDQFFKIPTFQIKLFKG